jgi:hypothetical protein
MPYLEQTARRLENTDTGQDSTVELRVRDAELLDSLMVANAQSGEFHSPLVGIRFANETLAAIAQPYYSAEQIAMLEAHLEDMQTLSIPLVTGHTITIDGTEHSVSLLGATELANDGANHGEMSKMFYLRDHIQTARALMELYLQDPKRYEKEGELARHMFFSVMHCMSTPRQLGRFEHVIATGPAAGQEDWPHISLWFDDLHGEGANGWRNKQDTFQMLMHLTLDALDRDFIDESDLSPSHKKFLGSVVPLLTAVGFPNYETSGSWEEVAAGRTSVLAVETAIMHKISTMAAAGKNIDFLAEVYEQSGTQVSTGRAFNDQVEYMLDQGLREVGRRLPFESPDYDKNSVKYREGDAALAYVLMYGLPQVLAAKNIPIGRDQEIMTEQQIEDLVLAEIESLIDPETHAVLRYKGDSYQRNNFHTGAVQETVEAIKVRVKSEAAESGGEVNLEDKQMLRNLLTPQGREACWVHPLGQLSSWAASRHLEALQKGDTQGAQRYRQMSLRYFNYNLSNVTGDNQWNTVRDASGTYRLHAIKPYRVPECFITYQTADSKTCTVASPHTPLNWGSVMLKLSIGLLGIGIKHPSA